MNDFHTPEEIYQTLSNAKISYGVFHKCLFHLHTPSSHDYEYFKTKEKITESTLARKCIERGLFSAERKDEFLKYYDNAVFKDTCEFFAFILIAATLFQNEIELVLITDHHTIDGYDKLRNAIDILYEKRNYLGVRNKKLYPMPLLGIELSCADKNHVVGIFNNKNKDNTLEKSKKIINNFLKEYLMDKKDGLYITSLEAIEQIFQFGGIAYIAHIKSSPMFSSDEKFLSGAYKKKLFSCANFHIAGVHKIEQASSMLPLLEQNTKRNFAIVLDSDAHDIDSIANGIFWIKGRKPDFDMISSALLDAKNSIRLNEPKSPDVFIEGLLIEGTDGFLTGQGNNFIINFSDSLNCLIGGRGTGKSTILSLIELVLAQRFANINLYDAMSKYVAVWLLCKAHSEEYLVSFIPLEKIYPNDTTENNLIEHLKKSYGITKKNIRFSDRSVTKLIREKCISIYKVTDMHSTEFNEIVHDTKKMELLEKIFGQRYIVNELVKLADEDRISNYITEIMRLEDLIKGRKYNFKDKQSLIKFLKNHNSIMSERRQEIENKLAAFNASQNNKLRIVYKQSTCPFDFIDFEYILKHSGHFGKNNKYNITLDGIVGFLYECCKKIGLVPFVKLILERNFQEIERIMPITNFCEELTQEQIDNDTKDVSKDPLGVVRLIVDDLLRLENTYITEKFNDDYIQSVEKLTLEFNIDNTSTNDNAKKTDFKEVSTLSQGQKVVAMLSFVMGYTTFQNDSRPLIIDQPEDNLDNKYIYTTLTKIILEEKNNKQIIIATHNSTIVINGKAEQVIVLDSDGLHGYILDCGYSDEKKIKKHIINQLEGGLESFRRKYIMYRDLLN